MGISTTVGSFAAKSPTESPNSTGVIFGSSTSSVCPLFIPYKKYSARSVAIRNASFTDAIFQPNTDTFPLLSILISTISSNVIFSVDLTAELIVLVANSVVFCSAININGGRIPRSIIQIVKQIKMKNNIVVTNNRYRIGGGDPFRRNRTCFLNSKTPL